MTCSCGHVMYRDLAGDWHCIRCERAGDTCPACDGAGYRLRGRIMRTCELCGGLGSREPLTANQEGCS